MFDLPKPNGNWQIPKPSITQVLATGLALSLIFSLYLVSRRDVRAVLFSSQEASQLAAADSRGLPSELLTTPTAILAQPTLFPSAVIGTMMAQLQDMQNQLQITSSLLEQKSQVAGLPPAANIVQSSLPPEDIAALWAEIDQLDKVMQPLMVQLETATANSSTRSASELIALRTKVNTIHQRLGYLLQRVEAAKGQPGMPHSSHSGTNPVISDQATYQQLYQTMTELQSLLQQMETQGMYP